MVSVGIILASAIVMERFSIAIPLCLKRSALVTVVPQLAAKWTENFERLAWNNARSEKANGNHIVCQGSDSLPTSPRTP